MLSAGFRKIVSTVSNFFVSIRTFDTFSCFPLFSSKLLTFSASIGELNNLSKVLGISLPLSGTVSSVFAGVGAGTVFCFGEDSDGVVIELFGIVGVVGGATLASGEIGVPTPEGVGSGGENVSDFGLTSTDKVFVFVASYPSLFLKAGIKLTVMFFLLELSFLNESVRLPEAVKRSVKAKSPQGRMVSRFCEDVAVIDSAHEIFIFTPLV